MMRRTAIQPRFAIARRQRGLSLLEAMIATIVIAIGLLGVAKMQSASLLNTQSASQRSIATALAYDLADRMRANQSGVRDGAYLAGIAADRACRLVHHGHTHNPPANCTATDLAQDDLFDWAQAAAAALPNARWAVCIDSTPDDGTATAPACDNMGSSYAVKLWWDDKPGDTAGGTRDVVASRVAIRFQP